MGKSLHAHMLVQIGDDQKFVSSEVELHPGQGFSHDKDETVLLSSGFSSVFPNSSFPLSSTLQLNGDLVSSDITSLENIARAELGREQAKEFSSYMVDADARLCVIGSSTESLDDFVETFGGLLAIEPLLVQGAHPDYPMVTEMSLEPVVGKGVSVEYGVRAPIDTSKCTYCGACGSICPEKCISPDLYVDFNLCTFCKKCEEACPADAVEIYGVEYRTSKFPAVVILDGCKIDGASQCSKVFDHEGVADYLKTLYSFQVEEIVSVNSEFCQFNSDLGKGCTACLQSCRYGAISIKDGVSVDPLVCEECGDCVAACPTGVLQYERFNDAAFVDYLQHLDLKDKTVVLAGSEILHEFWWQNRDVHFEDTFFLSLEKVEFLSIFNLLYLYSRGAGRIVIVQSEGEAGRVMAREAKLAGVMLASLFESENPIVLTDSLDTSLFCKFDNPLADVFSANQWLHRRAAVADTLQFICNDSDKTPGFNGNDKTLFATISCDEERCTQCMSCINICKVRAMRSDETELILAHRGALCVGCGLCVKVCPEQALELTRSWQFTPQFFEEGVLAAGDPMSCKECGKVFGTRKSFERVMSILKAKEAVDTSHFEYCEDCRVIRLFEEE